MPKRITCLESIDDLTVTPRITDYVDQILLCDSGLNFCIWHFRNSLFAQLDRRTLLRLYVPGFQRQVFNHVEILSEPSKKLKPLTFPKNQFGRAMNSHQPSSSNDKINFKLNCIDTQFAKLEAFKASLSSKRYFQCFHNVNQYTKSYIFLEN